jgi:hypothetical protein
MVRPARFERATAWFVARYSIQLSYGRLSNILLFEMIILGVVRPARFERATAWFAARYSIQLSYGRLLLKQCVDGAPGTIRTCDRLVRSQVLYPAELRAQMAVREGFEPSIEFPLYALSRGAPSATRPSHQSTARTIQN